MPTLDEMLITADQALATAEDWLRCGFQPLDSPSTARQSEARGTVQDEIAAARAAIYTARRAADRLARDR